MIATIRRSTVESNDRIAFGWGLGEAVLFFVIPDVFLSLIAIRFGLRRSARLAVVATAGAVLGGLVVYAWAAVHPASAFGAMDLLPGIDADLIAAVRTDVVAEGNAALLAGPWQGQPYKLFAAASGEFALSPVGLVLLTIPGRLARFLVSVSVAAYLRRFSSRWVSEKALLGFWAGFWILVYAGYWFG